MSTVAIMTNTTAVLEPTHILTPYEVNRVPTESVQFRQWNDGTTGERQYEVTKAPKTSVASKMLLDALPTSPEEAKQNSAVGWRENWTIHLPGYDYEIVGWVKNNTLDWVLERIDKENNA